MMRMMVMILFINIHKTIERHLKLELGKLCSTSIADPAPESGNSVNSGVLVNLVNLVILVKLVILVDLVILAMIPDSTFPNAI